MPPPRAAISWYVAPWLRSSNSSTRVPAKTGCVCASTKPGRTTRPPASITFVSVSINCSISAIVPTRSIKPSRTTNPPFSTIPSSRNSAPTRGRAGPASVTTCEQLITANFVPFCGLLAFSEDINRDANHIRQQHRAGDLQCKRKRALHICNRHDSETDVDKRDNEARRTRDLEPKRRFHAKGLHPKQRNRKQREVRQRVEDSAGVVQQLKRFLRAHSCQTK